MSYRDEFTTSYIYERKKGDRDQIREILAQQLGRVSIFSQSYLCGRCRTVGREDLEELMESLRDADIDTTFFVLFCNEGAESWTFFYYAGLWGRSRFLKKFEGGWTFLESKSASDE